MRIGTTLYASPPFSATDRSKVDLVNESGKRIASELSPKDSNREITKRQKIEGLESQLGDVYVTEEHIWNTTLLQAMALMMNVAYLTEPEPIPESVEKEVKALKTKFRKGKIV